VQGILWLEFFSFLPSLLHDLQMLTLVEWSNLVIGMTIPILGWMLIKPYLLQAKQIAPLKAQLRKFKYNKALFNKMMNDEVKYPLPEEEHSLIIGNREAEHIITIVSNPYCQPCSEAHKMLDEWLHRRDDVKLQIVFSTSESEEDKKNTVASHLMSLQAARNNESLKRALDDWYEQKQKNYEGWAKEYPVKDQTNYKKALHEQREWCKLTEITSTPTLFINGRKLPINYQATDIQYFI
jgi:protein-disulfide isomerase